MSTNSIKITRLGLLLGLGLLAAEAGFAGVYDQQTPVADTATKKISGKVVNAEGRPVTEADVTNKTNGETVQTNKTGSFSLAAHAGDELAVQLEGYATSNYTITGLEKGSLQLVLREQSLSGSRSLHLPAGIRPADQVTSSYDVVYNKDLIKSPVVDITNALAGRLTGLYTLQQGATPGSEKANLYVRGISNPLIVIDGIPRPYTLLNPAEIESVTVLKDALAANLYGMRAANGALLINTRKGVPGRQTISFTAQYGIQQPTTRAQYLNAYDYARLFNEALSNDGKPALYTEADLAAYKNGSDPYGHPDVDWQKALLRDQTRFTRYSADISGGGKFAQYYLALDHVNQQGIFTTDAKNSYNTNNDYKQYSIRSNVTMNVNTSLKAFLNVFALVQNGNQPGVTTSSVFSAIPIVPNNAYPIRNPDNSFAGTTERTTNLLGNVINAGYLMDYNRNLYADVGLQQSLDRLLKGLWVKAKASFGTDLTEYIIRSKTYATYKMNIGAAGDTTYTKFNTDGTQSNTGGVLVQSRNNYWEATLGYDRSFAGGHTVGARAIASAQQYGSDADLPLQYNNYSFNGTYNYKGRYDLELALTAQQQNRYPSAKDVGVFPAAGIGWTISQESWFPHLKSLNSLRLKSSYGRVGLDDVGYYVYQQYYNSSGGYVNGVSPTTVSGITEASLANPNVTWAKADKLNIGAEAELLQHRLRVALEYYRDSYFDLMQVRGRSLAFLGNTWPEENIGKNLYKGWDLSVHYNDAIGNVKYYAGLKLSTRQSEIVFMDEVDRKYDWMKRTGQKVEQLYGYIAEGFYSAADISGKLPTLEGYSPVPGDIKYRDLNGDGVINRYDVTAIGNQHPFISGGLQAGVEYKGISFSFLLQGTANRDLLLNSSNYEFQTLSGGGYGQAQAHHLDRWTPETAGTATYPRLTVGNNVNNQTASTFWLHKGDYLRLKNIELAWSVPTRWINAVKLTGARVFINGFNLFTLTEVDRLDPEYPAAAGYPIQKVFNAGVNLKF
ncbi:SusC/RagA family TonB-linked outer membrane protein [Paraflavitalea pollutisoli]|uniref:SusC/RagA family TonB-linked outer membrane protein n=1 Tax=Paraflavitalea pollutisoli TaxID=3034143 RepID=UPI0023ED1EBA|nr:SusC/RagA family TonB-linked outer membrane protein [Paraflavitalea sp. H1-2-19X]